MSSRKYRTILCILQLSGFIAGLKFFNLTDKIISMYISSLRLLLFFFLLQGCVPDQISDNLDIELTESRKSGRDLVTLKYDMDYTSLVKASGNLTMLDKALMTPKSSKKHIELTIRDNGEIKLITEELNSSFPITINHGTLPNNDPAVFKSEFDNNLFTLYDIYGNIISSAPATSPESVLLADQLDTLLQQNQNININDIITCYRSNLNTDALDFPT